jgi:hypothetical protein
VSLIENWREELNTAWSVKGALFVAFLGVADQILTAFVGAMPPLMYTALMFVIIVLRVVDQK